MAKLSLMLIPILLIVIISNMDSAQGQAKVAIECMADLNTKAKQEYQDEPTWRDGALNAHNKLRKQHGAPPLIFNLALCKYAQYLADVNLGSEKLVHSSALGEPSGLCGENIYEKKGVAGSLPEFPKPEEIVNTWYNYKSQYDYNNPEGATSVEAGHFTQVIWKGTTDFCIASSDNEANGTYVVVAVYYPKGNTAGGFKANVRGGSPSFLPSALLMAVSGIILFRLK